MDFTQADIAVVGGGAAGCMAAICAGRSGKRVLLIERNHAIGRKILLTGNGRCNFTNIAPLEQFLKKIRPNGQFYRNAFGAFFNQELIAFFTRHGVKHKVEDRGRVLPQSDDAKAVNAALGKALAENNVDLLYNCRVSAIRRHPDGFILSANGKDLCAAGRCVLAAGGSSYPMTGSSGDSFTLAASLGHTVSKPGPALAAVKLNEPFLKEVQGLALNDVALTLMSKGKKQVSDKGDILFTHFGLSGPLTLDISADVVSAVEKDKAAALSIDFAPDVPAAALEQDIFRACAQAPKAQMKTVLEEYLPRRMALVFLTRLRIESGKQANQMTKKERAAVIQCLKNFALAVDGVFPVEEAMVTNGGILLEEIDPRTMQSRLVPGLYVAGEALDGYCLSGGYNLQHAFSTGCLAGKSASR